jgi:hypothetical protein
LGKWGQAGSRTFTTRELAQLERTYSRLLAVKARLLEIQEHQEMSALFPTFLSLGKRIKSLLATDIKSIWQELERNRQTSLKLT